MSEFKCERRPCQNAPKHKKGHCSICGQCKGCGCTHHPNNSVIGRPRSAQQDAVVPEQPAGMRSCAIDGIHKRRRIELAVAMDEGNGAARLAVHAAQQARGQPALAGQLPPNAGRISSKIYIRMAQAYDQQGGQEHMVTTSVQRLRPAKDEEDQLKDWITKNRGASNFLTMLFKRICNEVVGPRMGDQLLKAVCLSLAEGGDQAAGVQMEGALHRAIRIATRLQPSSVEARVGKAIVEALHEPAKRSKLVAEAFGVDDVSKIVTRNRTGDINHVEARNTLSGKRWTRQAKQDWHALDCGILLQPKGNGREMFEPAVAKGFVDYVFSPTNVQYVNCRATQWDIDGTKQLAPTFVLKRSPAEVISDYLRSNGAQKPSVAEAQARADKRREDKKTGEATPRKFKADHLSVTACQSIINDLTEKQRKQHGGIDDIAHQHHVQNIRLLKEVLQWIDDRELVPHWLEKMHQQVACYDEFVKKDFAAHCKSCPFQLPAYALLGEERKVCINFELTMDFAAIGADIEEIYLSAKQRRDRQTASKIKNAQQQSRKKRESRLDPKYLAKRKRKEEKAKEEMHALCAAAVMEKGNAILADVALRLNLKTTAALKLTAQRHVVGQTFEQRKAAGVPLSFQIHVTRDQDVKEVVARLEEVFIGGASQQASADAVEYCTQISVLPGSMVYTADTCNQCAAPFELLEVVKQRVKALSDDVVSTEDRKHLLEHLIPGISKSFVLYMGHLNRGQVQADRAVELLRKVTPGSGRAHIVADFKQKIMPGSNRESQSDYYKKVATTFHGLCVLYPNNDISEEDVLDKELDEAVSLKQAMKCNGYKVHYIAQLVEETFGTKQSASLVYALLEAALTFIKRSQVFGEDIHTVSIQSDNATTYGNSFLISMAPILAQLTGVKWEILLHNEPGLGKTLLDSWFGVVTRTINRYLDEEGSETTSMLGIAGALKDLANTTVMVVENIPDRQLKRKGKGGKTVYLINRAEHFFSLFQKEKKAQKLGFTGIQKIREFHIEGNVIQTFLHSTPRCPAVKKDFATSAVYNTLKKAMLQEAEDCTQGCMSSGTSYRMLSSSFDARSVYRPGARDKDAKPDRSLLPTLEQQFRCEVCDASYARLQNLLKHHNPTAEVPIVCNRSTKKRDLGTFCRRYAFEVINRKWSVYGDRSVRVHAAMQLADMNVDLAGILKTKWADHPPARRLPVTINTFIADTAKDFLQAGKRLRSHKALMMIFDAKTMSGLPMFIPHELPRLDSVSQRLSTFESKNTQEALSEFKAVEEEASDVEQDQADVIRAHAPRGVEWVMCDNCQKWRTLPRSTKAADLPEAWQCDMNTWSSYNECSVPQEPDAGADDSIDRFAECVND